MEDFSFFFLEFHLLVTFLKNFLYTWQKNLSIGQKYRALRENVKNLAYFLQMQIENKSKEC